MGYSIGRRRAQEILNTGINPAWLSGIFTYPEYIAEYIQKVYPDKPSHEKRNLFMALLIEDDKKDDFPDWRKTSEAEATARDERRREEEAARERRRILDEARANKPTACGNCGAPLAPKGERGSCYSCDYEYSFNYETGTWEFGIPAVSLAAEFKDRMSRKHSQYEAGATV